MAKKDTSDDTVVKKTAAKPVTTKQDRATKAAAKPKGDKTDKPAVEKPVIPAKEVTVTSTAKPIIASEQKPLEEYNPLRTLTPQHAQIAAPVITNTPVVLTELQKLEAFAKIVEKHMDEHIGGLPMSKNEAFAFIKKSRPQYMVTINAAPVKDPTDYNEPKMSIITISLGQMAVNLKPYCLHGL